MFVRRSRRLAVCAAFCTASVLAATVPRHSPEFAIDTPGGKEVLLSQYRGKVVALIFILTYCPHCQKAIQTLEKLQSEFGPQGFQVLASAIEDGAAAAVPDFVRRYQTNFPVGFNNRNTVTEYLQHPPMLKLLMPQLVFVDRHGEIRAQYTGDQPFFGNDEEQNMRAEIEKLLKERSTSRTKKQTTRAAR